MHFLTKKTAVLAAVTLFLHFSLLPPTIKAEEARIKDISVINSWDHCILSFSVTGCFTEEMKKAIENGINTTFTFYIELYEIRDFWWDRQIADLSVSHHIKYDNLKKVYTVTLSEKDNKVFYVEDFDKAKKFSMLVRTINVHDPNLVAVVAATAGLVNEPATIRAKIGLTIISFKGELGNVLHVVIHERILLGLWQLLVFHTS